ncbi:hypothetical protein PsorP6_012117 [Peronosclerospora sorghi]|uniref:Uncharacterized protein n=1 Tax=Peronosclerospora sorghi TaxID=230839 RepID=A0ACC0WK18_9STRA|nr:hypothetical protein PsorP6_012117 [Peronosclerospora sorghi]
MKKAERLSNRFASSPDGLISDEDRTFALQKSPINYLDMPDTAAYPDDGNEGEGNADGERKRSMPVS